MLPPLPTPPTVASNCREKIKLWRVTGQEVSLLAFSKFGLQTRKSRMKVIMEFAEVARTWMSCSMTNFRSLPAWFDRDFAFFQQLPHQRFTSCYNGLHCC